MLAMLWSHASALMCPVLLAESEFAMRSSNIKRKMVQRCSCCRTRRSVVDYRLATNISVCHSAVTWRSPVHFNLMRNLLIGTVNCG